MAFNQYVGLAIKAATDAGIDPSLFVKQIMQESGFNPQAVSSAGARGIAQFMPATARGLGINPDDPAQAIPAAAQLMAQYTKQFGSYANALVAYNAGPGAVGKPLPAETQQYVGTIMGGGGMGTDMSQMTDEQLLAALGGSQNPYVTDANLPPGFILDARNKKIINTFTGQPATAQEVYTALQAQHAAAQAANPASITAEPWQASEANSNARFGAQEAGTNARAGFNGELTARSQNIDMLKIAQDNLLTQAQMAEKAQMDRASLGESAAGRQTTANMAALNRVEQARQANLQAAVDQYKTAMGLIPQMGQLSLAESQQVGQILNSGGDYLARAFSSRGGTSPLAPVMQADQINALTSTLQKLRDQVNTSLQQGPALPGIEGQAGQQTGFVPGPQVGAYQAPNMSGLPQVGAAPQFQQPGAYQAPSMEGYPTPAGGGAGGGFQVPDLGTPQGPYLGPGFTGVPEGDYRDVQAQPSPAVGNVGFTGVPEGDYHDPTLTAGTPNQWAIPNSPTPLYPATGASGAGMPDNPTFGMPVNGQSSTQSGSGGGGIADWWARLNQPGTSTPQFAKGSKGFTGLPHFRVGEKGPEHIFNPTGAPVAVVPEPKLVDEATKSIQGKKVKGFATGTGDIGGGGLAGFFERLNEPQPTTGFGSGPTGGSSTTGILGSMEGYSPDATAMVDPKPAVYPGVPRYPQTAGTPTQGQPFAVPGVPQYNLPGSNPFQLPAGPAPITQAELVRMAQQNSPPSVQALFGNVPVPAYQALRSTDPNSTATLPGFTARQMAGLNAEDMQALGTRTNTEFNAPLSFVQDRIARQYGSSPIPQGQYSRYFRGFLGGQGV